jgi:hypothetical protein
MNEPRSHQHSSSNAHHHHKPQLPNYSATRHQQIKPSSDSHHQIKPSSDSHHQIKPSSDSHLLANISTRPTCQQPKQEPGHNDCAPEISTTVGFKEFPFNKFI